MNRAAPLLCLLLAACHRAPATQETTAAPVEVWIPPAASEAPVAAAPVPTAPTLPSAHDVAIRAPAQRTALARLRKAEADLIAAERDYRRQKEIASACSGGGGRDVEAAEATYRQAKAEVERARRLLGERGP